MSVFASFFKLQIASVPPYASTFRRNLSVTSINALVDWLFVNFWAILTIFVGFWSVAHLFFSLSTDIYWSSSRTPPSRLWKLPLCFSLLCFSAHDYSDWPQLSAGLICYSSPSLRWGKAAIPLSAIFLAKVVLIWLWFQNAVDRSFSTKK